MSNRDIANAILDKMHAKLCASASSAPRTCWVASAKACGKVTARVIVASIEPFTAANAIAAIHENLDRRVTPYAPSFTPLMSEAHPHLVFASVHCYKGSHKVRPADEANMANCQSITAATYLDVELGNVWERKEIDGKQYLLRANDDDLEEVMGIALTASVSPEVQVEADGFVVTTKVGDYVTFFAAEQAEDFGLRPYMELAQVTEVTASSVGVALSENGHTANAYLPSASVVNIIEAAALDGNTSREDVLNFLKECYGPDYVAALNSLK